MHDKKRNFNPPTISPDTYTRDYFEYFCHGAEQFRVSWGRILPNRLAVPLKLAGIRSGDYVLDIGCGRGELAIHCALYGARVWAIDYAPAALELALKALSYNNTEIQNRIILIRSDARFVPICDESIDVVFMIDVIEHLAPFELDQALQEARRVLKKNGRLIIHTMPNLLYYNVGYPLYRTIQALRGIELPANPRDRWPFKEVHINEQTPFSLWQTLKKNGFKARIFLKSTQQYEQEKNNLLRLGMIFLSKFPVINFLFCNEIFAIAKKR